MFRRRSVRSQTAEVASLATSVSGVGTNTMRAPRVTGAQYKVTTITLTSTNARQALTLPGLSVYLRLIAQFAQKGTLVMTMQ